MKIIYILFLTFNLSFAHPHTFIEVYPTIEVKDNIMTKINFKWKLDEMTSSMLIMEFDQNGDGKIDKKENKFVYDNYFSTLRDMNFYTNLKIKNKIQIFPKPNNFKATIEDNKICYSFNIEGQYNINDIAFEFGDEDFFVAMILKDKFTNIMGAKAKVLELDNDFFFGYRLEVKEIQ